MQMPLEYFLMQGRQSGKGFFHLGLFNCCQRMIRWTHASFPKHLKNAFRSR
ncbi:hypothetical protein ACFSKU_14930 [Pontibacter silvestris]|uniref:Uncharacterized protein n=1 Tax=Pontibacter silvestris TaxID=2305183 RepID=A0ABW4WZL9_9BACT|nr:hypothetical protein [Pontibacter silvestris]